jgi:hypothetical protein
LAGEGVSLERTVKKDSQREMGLQHLSMRVVDNSMAFQLAEALEKADRDIKSIPVSQGRGT